MESKSNRIVFEELFDSASVELKDEKRVRQMTIAHDALLGNGDLTDVSLYDYCVSLWSLVDFVRAHRDLKTTKPLEFTVRGWSCNCYWWEVLSSTVLFAERASKLPELKADDPSGMRVAHVQNYRMALGLLHKLRAEALPAWKNRTEDTEFLNEIKAQIATADRLQSQLWARILRIVAVYIGDDVRDAHKVAQVHARIYELTNKTEKRNLTAALLSESLYLYHIGENANALAMAQLYEKLLPDVAHTYRAEWAKKNETAWRLRIPVYDADAALQVIGTTSAHEKGEAPAKLVLFAIKSH